MKRARLMMDAPQDAPGCAKVPSSKQIIDRKQLAEAIKMLKKQQSVEFALGKQILGNEILSAFKIETLGDIQIPVSLENVERIKQLPYEAHNKKQNGQMYDCSLAKTWQIDSSKVLLTTPGSVDIPTIIAAHLGLPTKSLTTEVKLDKIILWENGGPQHESQLNSKNKFGLFGTAILQLPLEGGHEGGRYKVEYKGINKVFESHENSDQLFYLSAFYGDSKHVMEPLTRGWKLVLVFNLVWEDAKISETLQDFPIFLSAVKEVQKALTPWISQEEGNMETENITDIGKSIEKNEESPIKPFVPLKDTADSSNDSEDEGPDSSDYYLQFDLSTEALKEQMLYFVLKEKYDVNNISIRRLQGEDRKLAHLLESCRFLDVHLAMVTLKNVNEEINGWSRCSQEMVSAKVTQIVDSNDAPINLRLPLNWYKQRVGPLRKLLTSRGETPDREKRTYNTIQAQEKDDCSDIEEEEDDDYEDCDAEEENDLSGIVIRNQYFYHFILVIWPKHLTYQMYSRYGLHSLIDRMENSLNSTPIERKVEARQESIQELQKIISFCHAHPKTDLSYTNEKGRKPGELTYRLLRFCIALRAREEGLLLLKMMSQGFEGIKSEEVAQAIVEFLCQVSSWDDCADLIKPMLTPEKIFKQLLPVTKLGQYLFDANCLEEAKTVADWISSSLLDLNPKSPQNFRQNEVYSYVNLIVSLESKPITSNLERMKCFVSLFPKLDRYVQSHLILDLGAENNSFLFSSNESCQFLYLELFKAFLACDLHRCYLDDRMGDVLKSYVRLGNAELLKTLISNVCRVSTTSETSAKAEASKNRLLEPLLSSAFFWELGSSFNSSAACMEWYRDTCKIFLSQDFVTPFNSTMDVKLKIVNCLLLLNDDQSWQSFALKICEFFPHHKTFEFLRVFLKNVEIQQALLQSSSGFASFTRLIDHCTKRWKSVKEPNKFSWEQPEAYLPDYPEVEAFLRSPEQQSLTYTEPYFTGISYARFVAKKFKKLQKLNGFSISVKLKGNRKSYACVITKKRSHHECVKKNYHACKSDLEELVKLRGKLSEEYQKLQKIDDGGSNDIVMSE